MQQIPINWLAVIVAAIIRMAIGSAWYSPALFVKPWQALSGVTPESMRAGLGKAIGIDAAMSLVMAFVLFHAGAYYAYGTGVAAPGMTRVFEVLTSSDLVNWRSLGVG